MKIFILLKFVFFAVVFFEPAAFSQISQPEQSVWKITIPGLLTNSGIQGTGFFIGKNRFVTNSHVISGMFPKSNNLLLKLFSIVEEESRIGKIVLSQEGNPSTLHVKRVIALSGLYDLALLETEQSVTNYLKLKVEVPKSGEKLVFPGYPNGVFKKTETAGPISSHEDVYFYKSFIKSSEVISGASGSPLLNRKGQVVGVIDRGSAGPFASISAVKAIHLKEFVRGNVGTKNLFSVKECVEEEKEEVMKLAEKGNLQAQYRLYKWYSSNDMEEEGIKKNPELALQWLKEAVEGGYIPAQNDMEEEGFEKNPELALQWLKRAAEGGYIPAQYDLSQLYSGGEVEIGIVEIRVKENPELALKWLKRAAEQGYVLAQYELYLHYSGSEIFAENVEKNPELALKWLERAAEQGYTLSQYELYLHYNGRETFTENVVKNPDLALKWLSRAADQEHSQAQYDLYLYYNDEKNGKKKNPKLAFKWLERAAENEHPQAQYELYLHYSSGETAQTELALALQWLKRAANQKHSQAQYDLYLYYNSEEKGRQRNPRLALKWLERLKDNTSLPGTFVFYRFAIRSYEKGEFKQALEYFKTTLEQGDTHAQYKLGMMYYKGQGTKKDLKQASEHFKAAAENGDSFAQYRLAMMYRKGLGVEKNPKLAFKWLEKAAQQGHPLAQSFLSKFLCHAAVTEQ